LACLPERRSPRDDLVQGIRTAEDTGEAIGGECREQDRNTGAVGCGAVAAEKRRGGILVRRHKARDERRPLRSVSEPSPMDMLTIRRVRDWRSTKMI
jgi:hypothetical protein